jgi:para-nitrobenzyl esterase
VENVMIHRRTLFGAMAGLLAANAKAQTMADAPIAATTHGRVRGATDQGIHVFKAIPYGATTAGAARFHAPASPAGWSGIRDALAYPPMAPQSMFAPGSLFASWTFDKEISEDCLALVSRGSRTTAHRRGQSRNARPRRRTAPGA